MGRQTQNLTRTRNKKIDEILKFIISSEYLKSHDTPENVKQSVLPEINKSEPTNRARQILESVTEIDLDCYHSILDGHLTNEAKKDIISGFLYADEKAYNANQQRLQASQEQTPYTTEPFVLDESEIPFDFSEDEDELHTTVPEGIIPESDDDSFGEFQSATLPTVDSEPEELKGGPAGDEIEEGQASHSGEDEESILFENLSFGARESFDQWGGSGRSEDQNTLQPPGSYSEEATKTSDDNEVPGLIAVEDEGQSSEEEVAPRRNNMFATIFRRNNGDIPRLSEEEKEKLKRRNKAERIKRKRAKRHKKFSVVGKIIDEDFSEEPEAERREMKRYYAKEFYRDFDNNITDDIHSDRSFVLKLVKPLLITRKYLRRYFKTVVKSYAKYNDQVLQDGYSKDPKKWFDSAPNRPRLVLFEATDTNLEEIAKRMLKASSIERIVVVGLDAEKKEMLRGHLANEWKAKIADHEKETAPLYTKKVFDCLCKDEPDYSISTPLGDFPLNKLTGPHTFIEKKDISYQHLIENIGHSFSSKIDDISFYGHSNELVNQIPQLAYDTKVKLYQPIKSSAIVEGDSPVWIASFNEQVTNPYQILTSGNDPRDILQEAVEGQNENLPKSNLFSSVKNFLWPGFDLEVIESKEKNFNLNPALEAIFRGENLDRKESEFFLDIFSQYSLYGPNLSPSQYSSTVTKTQSGINGEGAVVVGNALIEGVFGRQVATAKGVLFAVNSTMFDSSNDDNLERQKKILGYKKIFEGLFVTYCERDMDVEAAFEEAIKGTIAAYKSIEKREAILRNEKAGRNARNYTLENANKTNIENRIGINLLLPLPLGVLFGAITAPLGVALAVVGFAASIAFPIIGLGMLVGMTSFLATSLFIQRDANADKLARWHRSSARAHAFVSVANDKREQYQTELLEQLKQDKDASLANLIQVQENKESSSESQSTDENLGTEEHAMSDPEVKAAYESILKEREPLLREKRRIFDEIVTNNGRFTQRRGPRRTRREEEKDVESESQNSKSQRLDELANAKQPKPSVTKTGRPKKRRIGRQAAIYNTM